MSKQAKRFLRNWTMSCLVLVIALVIFNALVDPYLLFGMPRMAGFNARKPAIETQDPLIKAYDVLRAAPNTLIVGTSMFELGLDARHQAWPAQKRPVYNLALRGGGPYTSYRYLQHVMSQRQVALVVMGLDFQFFLNVPDPLRVRPEFESRLAVRRDGSRNGDQRRQYVRDIINALLTLDALIDSTSTLAANLSRESPDIVDGNWDNSEYFRFTSALGAYQWGAQWSLWMIRRYHRKQTNPLVMKQVQAILELAESHGTHVILIINPVHADELEMFDRMGLWPAYEDWKRQLVAVTARYPGAGGPGGIPLWDFSGYHSYSTESVPTDRRLLHWFRDSSHFTRALGSLIVQRISGTGDVDFGVLLHVETIESHLTAIRAQQRLYRERQQADVRRVRKLYDSATSDFSQASAKN